MKLRTVTIWTTGLMLLLTTAVPVLLFLGGYLQTGDGMMASIVIAVLLWSFSAPPLIVSLMMAWKLKEGMPSVVILVTTIAYGVLYVCGWCVQWFMTSRDTGIWFLGVLVLPVMIPVWIVVLILNASLPDPGKARSTG